MTDTDYQTVLDWGDATPEQWDTILTQTAEIVSSWFQTRAVNLEDLADRLDGLDLDNGRILDLGDSFLTPAMLTIERYARAVRRQLTTDSPVPLGPDETLLFAIHVEGPDDIIPMPNSAHAIQKAAECNTAVEEYARQHPSDVAAPTWRARVVFWPGNAGDHRRELARLRKEDPDGWLS